MISHDIRTVLWTVVPPAVKYAACRRACSAWPPCYGGQADYPVAAATDVIASISCWTLLQPASASHSLVTGQWAG